MTVVWVPVAYEATVREPRWQSAKDLLVREIVPIEIEIRSETELPLTIAGKRNYRHDGTDWWRELAGPDGKPVDTFPEASDTAWADYPFSCPSPFAKIRHAPSDKSEISYSSRDGRLADVSRDAADLLFVDGSLWRRCREPVLVLTLDGLALNGKLAVDILPHDATGADSALYRLDERDELASVIKRIKGTVELTMPVAKPKFELLRKPVFTADLFSVRAQKMRDALDFVIAEFPVDLSEIVDTNWLRVLDQTDADNDWEFLDALETASERADGDLGVALAYLTRHLMALTWQQVEADLEAGRLNALPRW